MNSIGGLRQSEFDWSVVYLVAAVDGDHVGLNLGLRVIWDGLVGSRGLEAEKMVNDLTWPLYTSASDGRYTAIAAEWKSDHFTKDSQKSGSSRFQKQGLTFGLKLTSLLSLTIRQGFPSLKPKVRSSTPEHSDNHDLLNRQAFLTPASLSKSPLSLYPPGASVNSRSRHVYSDMISCVTVASRDHYCSSPAMNVLQY